VDLMADNVAADGSPVPVRFQHNAFPDPPGSCPTAIVFRAFIASSLFARPLNTSCGTPSPEQHSIASYASTSISRAISTACPLRSVVCTSRVQFAASKIGRQDVSNSRAALPWPPKGLIKTLYRGRCIDATTSRQSGTSSNAGFTYCHTPRSTTSPPTPRPQSAPVFRRDT